MTHPNVPAWFEIPVSRLDRAQRFYEGILGIQLTRTRMGGGDLAVFPYGGKPHVGGALIAQDDCEPSVMGSIVYLHVENVEHTLARVLAHHGDTLVPRTALPDGIGYFAQIVDSEGNRVGLFSTH